MAAGLNMREVNGSIVTSLSTSESEVRTLMGTMDTSKMGPQEMLKAQVTISFWTTMTQIGSAVQKETIDAVKGVIHNIS